MRVLIVEDDPALGDLLVRMFDEEGYEPELRVDYGSGLRAAHEPFDVVVLDWMLPGGDGPSFCESMRRAGIATPILMLTARGEVQDRVKGLRCGADDYLVKPFEVDELLARIDALVRRSRQATRVVAGGVTIDRLARRCTLNEVELDLTIRELDLLVRLAAAGGETVSRTELLRDVWHIDFDPGSGVLEVQISRLREKLTPAGHLIETVRGLGYRLKVDE